ATHFREAETNVSANDDDQNDQRSDHTQKKVFHFHLPLGLRVGAGICVSCFTFTASGCKRQKSFVGWPALNVAWGWARRFSPSDRQSLSRKSCAPSAERLPGR